MQIIIWDFIDALQLIKDSLIQLTAKNTSFKNCFKSAISPAFYTNKQQKPTTLFKNLYHEYMKFDLYNPVRITALIEYTKCIVIRFITNHLRQRIKSIGQ